METLSFFFYLLLTGSYFLHFGSRFPLLGDIRIDLILMILIILLKLLGGNQSSRAIQSKCERKLQYLIITILIITPFAQFPGSVIRHGIPIFIKALIFFYFTVWYITTEKRLRIFVYFFVLCQTFRIFEPLYLHVTQGYWGDRASMLGGEEFMSRLAGAPSDVVNSNGLAYVILSVLSFIPFFIRINYVWKLIVIVITPVVLYALILTGSRSGLLVLFILGIYLFLKSNRKGYYIAGAVIIGMFMIANMSAVLKDRYSSIYDPNTMNAATSAGRLEGLIGNFELGLKRPIFGHGLGTSLETNYNYEKSALKSHNIFLEVFEELGLVGFIVFFMFLWEIYIDIFRKRQNEADARDNRLMNLQEALAALFIVTFFYDFASYGLSIYPWYFIGGLNVSLWRINEQIL
jgi:O-antigen ligase